MPKHAPDIDPSSQPLTDIKHRRQLTRSAASRKALVDIVGRWEERTGLTEIEPMQGPARVAEISKLAGVKAVLKAKRFTSPEGVELVAGNSVDYLRRSWPSETLALLARRPIKVLIESKLAIGVGRQPYYVDTYEEIDEEGLELDAAQACDLASRYIHFIDIEEV